MSRYPRSVGMRRAAVLVALSGCSSIFGLHEPTHGVAVDAPIDSVDGAMADASMCVGRGQLTVCFDTLPTNDVQLPATISTSVDSQPCATGVHWASTQQPAVCFIAGHNITQSGTTIVSGGRPLVVVASGNLTIAGLVDASSHLNGATGPDTDPASCGAFAAAPQSSGNGGGGGAGGSFVSAGGVGGGGNGGAVLGGQPAAVVAASTVLRGGCRGQPGGTGGVGSNGSPGTGGGAIYLAAGTQLVMTAGRIAANGGGAVAGKSRDGGPGGGAGGMIVIDAPTIMVTNSILTANGGGGASGADGNTGLDGSDPDPNNPTVPALGGGPGRGGPGGDGAAGMLQAGAGQDAPSGQTRGGGGGGGGFGVIYAPSSLANTGVSASPAITALP